MSEINGFTPGPWIAEASCMGIPPDAGCGVIASDDDKRISNPSRGIVAWATRLVSRTNAETIANARLIAAAPDMHAEINRLRAALAEAERERGEALDRLCTAPGEGDLVTAATEMKANYVEAHRRAERAEARAHRRAERAEAIILELLKGHVGMIERAESELAAAREVIEPLVHDLQYFSEREGGTDRFASLVKARAFLERTAVPETQKGPVDP